jgi:hypothetical protein
VTCTRAEKDIGGNGCAHIPPLPFKITLGSVHSAHWWHGQLFKYRAEETTEWKDFGVDKSSVLAELDVLEALKPKHYFFLGMECVLALSAVLNIPRVATRLTSLELWCPHTFPTPPAPIMPCNTGRRDESWCTIGPP